MKEEKRKKSFLSKMFPTSDHGSILLKKWKLLTPTRAV